jgi:hypothetical protein
MREVSAWIGDCSVATNVLGHIVEEICSKPSEVFRKEVFVPPGLHASGFVLATVKVERMANLRSIITRVGDCR